MTTLINGKAVSDKTILALKDTVADLKNTYNAAPGLAVILVGNNPASKAYVGRKKKACTEIGIRSYEFLLDEESTQAALETVIDELNARDDIDGILLQLPLPAHMNEDTLLQRIDANKDVDGFHPTNVGKLLLGLPTFRSCTPFGVWQLLKAYDIDTSGKHVVIVGRSNIVGKPLAAILLQRGDGADATVTVCHSKTQHLASITKQADILIGAIGKAHFITADMVKDNAVVIDVGINRVDADNEKGYALVGDVHFEQVKEKASAITPVPGGVGPMTIAMLMTNTVEAFVRRQNTL